jgi:hypothetical protein
MPETKTPPEGGARIAVDAWLAQTEAYVFGFFFW